MFEDKFKIEGENFETITFNNFNSINQENITKLDILINGMINDNQNGNLI